MAVYMDAFDTIPEKVDDIFTEEVTEYRMLQRGDHLAVPRSMYKIAYFHHGIFLGHDKGVAEFSGNSKANAKLLLTDLMNFHGKETLYRIIYPEGKCLSNENVVKIAEDYLQAPHTWGKYDLKNNNCEHFATRCKTGIADSKQVDEKIKDCIKNPTKYISAGSKMAIGSFKHK